MVFFFEIIRGVFSTSDFKKHLGYFWCFITNVMFVFLLGITNTYASSLSISLTEAPGLTTKGDPYMKAVIIGGDNNDLTPNLCAGKKWGDCSILAWLVERSWPNKQLDGYKSYDAGGINSESWRSCVNSNENKTLGKVIACWRNNGVLQRPLYDTISSRRLKSGPDFCLFYGRDTVQSASYPGPISNCASGYKPAESCKFGPNISINAKGTASEFKNMSASAESYLECTNTTSGTIKLTDEKGQLVLDGGGYCNLDLGSGPNKPHKLTVQYGMRKKVIAKCLFSGVNTLGLHRGAGIIVFTVD